MSVVTPFHDSKCYRATAASEARDVAHAAALAKERSDLQAMREERDQFSAINIELNDGCVAYEKESAALRAKLAKVERERDLLAKSAHEWFLKLAAALAKLARLEEPTWAMCQMLAGILSHG